MNAYFGWLLTPMPKTKAWHLVYLLAFGMFWGSWLQAFDSAGQRGETFPLLAHVIYLTPNAIMLIAPLIYSAVKRKAVPA